MTEHKLGFKTIRKKGFKLNPCKRCGKVPIVTKTGCRYAIQCDCKRFHTGFDWKVELIWNEHRDMENIPFDMQNRILNLGIKKFSELSGVSKSTLYAIMQGRECKKETKKKIMTTLESRIYRVVGKIQSISGWWDDTRNTFHIVIDVYKDIKGVQAAPVFLTSWDKQISQDLLELFRNQRSSTFLYKEKNNANYIVGIESEC